MKVYVIVYRNGSRYSIGTGKGMAAYLEEKVAYERIEMISKADGLEPGELIAKPVDADQKVLEAIGLDII